MRRRVSGRQTGSSSKEDQSPESKHRHPCHVNNHKWTNWDSLNASGKTNNLTGGLLFGNSKSWPLDHLWERGESSDYGLYGADLLWKRKAYGIVQTVEKTLVITLNSLENWNELPSFSSSISL